MRKKMKFIFNIDTEEIELDAVMMLIWKLLFLWHDFKVKKVNFYQDEVRLISLNFMTIVKCITYIKLIEFIEHEKNATKFPFGWKERRDDPWYEMKLEQWWWIYEMKIYIVDWSFWREQSTEKKKFISFHSINISWINEDVWKLCVLWKKWNR